MVKPGLQERALCAALAVAVLLTACGGRSHSHSVWYHCYGSADQVAVAYTGEDGWIAWEEDQSRTIEVRGGAWTWELEE